MKHYNMQNYLRYKDDLKSSIKKINQKELHEYPRDELIVMFLPMVEKIAKHFATSYQASGVLDITDLMQEGSIGLISAVDKLDAKKIEESEKPDSTLKSFLAKRIKGSIRRAIDINRGNIKIPEHKLNEIRNNPENEVLTSLFFNSVFKTYDDIVSDDDNFYFDIEDISEDYNIDILNKYLLSLMQQHLTILEYDVLRLSYGLDCDKHSAIDIAIKLDITVDTAPVRVSQIKRTAISKLIENTDYSQVIDLL